MCVISPRLSIITVLVGRSVNCKVISRCDISDVNLPLLSSMGSFVSTNDVRVEKRATRPVDVIEAVDDEIDAINVNFSLRDIAGLPPNSDVVKTRMLCIGLDDGVICTARAKGETVAVRVGLYEGVVKTYML